MMAKTLEGGDAVCYSQPVPSTDLTQPQGNTSNPAPTSEPESAGEKRLFVSAFNAEGVSEPLEVISPLAPDNGQRLVATYDNMRWADLNDAIANIRHLIEELNAYADSASRTRIVRQELHNSGLVKVPGYRKRRRE